MTDGTNPVIVPHEFTGPDTGGGRICRYCAGTPLECAHVFGPHCPQAAEAQAALAAPPANPVIVERVGLAVAKVLDGLNEEARRGDFAAVEPDEPAFRKLVSERIAQAALEAMPVVGLREALGSLCRKYAAAWAAITFARDEGFEWPTDPLGEEALAFADPTVVPEYAALAKVSGVSK